MDAPTIAALASLAVALVAFVGLAAPVYLRLGRLEGEVKAGKERADYQHSQAREHTDVLFAQAREHTDAMFAQAREHTDALFAQARERADTQHAETLGEIRRLTDAFLSHSHAPDGGLIFRIPPPAGSNSAE